MSSNAQNEALAQNDFLAALFRQSAAIHGATALHIGSLQAYRGNLAASVERALAAMYPSVALALSSSDFDALAQLYLAAHPPLRGDWAQYGGAFADWLHAQNPGGVVTALPFLPDLAALDAAMHRAESAADAPLEAASLQALAGDVAALRLVLHPAVAVLACAFSVLDWHAAPSAAPRLGAQALLVWRSGWRAQRRELPDAEATFVRLCLAGATIGQALHAASAQAEFDFERWLMAALQDGLIVGVQSGESGV